MLLAALALSGSLVAGPLAMPRAHAGQQRTYRLTPTERKLDCRGLASAIANHVDKMKTLRRKATKEAAAAPATVARMFGRWSGSPEAGNAALQDLAEERAIADAMNAALGSKNCARVDIDAALSHSPRTEGAITDRCQAHNNFQLSDCVEDIVQWRCRSAPKDVESYLGCMERVARKVIAASGSDLRRIGFYDPDCTAKDFSAASCSVFSNDRAGPGKEWCQRQTEDEINVCDQAKKNCHPVRCRLGACKRLCSPPA